MCTECAPIPGVIEQEENATSAFSGIFLVKIEALMILSATNAVCATRPRVDRPKWSLAHKTTHQDVSVSLRSSSSAGRRHRRFYIHSAVSGGPLNPIPVQGDLVFGMPSVDQQTLNPKDQEPAGEEEVIEVSPGRRGKVR